MALQLIPIRLIFQFCLHVGQVQMLVINKWGHLISNSVLTSLVRYISLSGTVIFACYLWIAAVVIFGLPDHSHITNSPFLSFNQAVLQNHTKVVIFISKHLQLLYILDAFPSDSSDLLCYIAGTWHSVRDGCYHLLTWLYYNDITPTYQNFCQIQIIFTFLHMFIQAVYWILIKISEFGAAVKFEVVKVKLFGLLLIV